MDWGKKWLVHLNAGKSQLVSFDRSNSTCSIDAKMDGSVLEEKMLDLTFPSKSTILPCVEYCCHDWAGAPTASVGLLVLHLLLLLNPWLIVKILPA